MTSPGHRGRWLRLRRYRRNGWTVAVSGLVGRGALVDEGVPGHVRLLLAVVVALRPLLVCAVDREEHVDL